MSDNHWKDGKTEPNDRLTQTSSPSYIYRWNYEDQRAFDTRQKKKKQKSGIAVYAVIMTVVFLLCFALLTATLIWYGTDAPVVKNPGDDQHETTNPGGMSTSDVSALVKPSTVLIYAANNTTYGYGTGFFLTSDGYIATNYHVVANKKTVSVTLYEGKELEAKVVGYSADDDLAVLKIDGAKYPAMKIGDSDALREGDVAIAVGNPSGEEGSWTTTQGIISALNRKVTVTEDSKIRELTMIQTDAALNPGNSGGPLCNDRGEVIGIVTRKLSDTEGISFAIPINGAMEILKAIMKDGNADGVQSSVSKGRPTIGITGGTIVKGDKYTYGGVEYAAEKNGIFVSSVDENGPANGILKVCDIIIEFDGQKVEDMTVLIELLYQYKINDKVDITVWRDGKAVTVEVTLGKAGS